MGKKPKKNAPKFPQQGGKPSPRQNMDFGNLGQSVYRRNLNALRKRDAVLAEKIENLQMSKYEVVATSEAKLPNLVRKSDGWQYYQGDDPRQNAKDEVDGLNLKNARLAVFLGFGLGYEFMYYTEALSNKQKTSAILVVENDLEIFKAALQTIDLVPALAHAAVDFAVGCDESELYIKMRNFFKTDSRHILAKAIKPVYHMSSMALYKDYYLKALQVLRESAAAQVLNFGNCPHDSLIGVENMLFNMGEILKNPGINNLYGKFKGRPAIVASTGPSLNKNKHLLKGLEEKALIICPDASLRLLIDMGVKPHMVTSLERVPETVQLFNNFTLEQVDDVYLAASPVVVKEVYESYPGPRIIVYRNLDHFKWLGVDRGILDIKLSSGNMAFEIAEAMGCDPIILIGQDLAFADDGASHAQGSVLGDRQDDIETGTMLVPGNNGGMVRTSPVYHSFLRSYELDVANYKGSCVNSTEGGAFIAGTTVMPFKEAIEKYINEDFSPLKVIKQGISRFSDVEIAKDVKRIRKLINDTENDVKKIISYCGEGFKSCQSYQPLFEAALQDAGKLEEVRADLDRIEKECFDPKRKAVGMHHTFQLFLAHVLQSYNIQFEMETTIVPEKYDDFDLARIEIILRHVEWYAVINDLCCVCLNSLLVAKKRVEEEFPVGVE